MNKKNKLIIISGGMDSVVLLHAYHEEIKLAVHFQYGQKHKKEMEFAKKNCEKFQIPLKVIDITNIGKHLESNLLESGGDIPEGHYEDETMKKTVVPFRNGIMLSIACGIAESNDCNKILIGNHAGDHAIYPDCRADFIHAMNNAMANGTYKNIGIFAPFTKLDKRQIGKMGKELKVNFKDTWTCYKGQKIHCGVCGSCTERKEALEGFDETEYKN